MKKNKKNKKDNKHVSGLKKGICLIFRGLKVTAAFPKPILLSKTISRIVSAASPFGNIYFSAQILNEIAGGRSRERLAALVLLAVSMNLSAMILKCAASRFMEYCESDRWLAMLHVYSEKLLAMDYIDIEDPEIRQRYSEIYQNQNGMGFGLPMLFDAYDGIITGITQILISAAMAFSLFTLKVPAGSPLTFLNSSGAAVIILLLLSCSIFISPYISMIGGRIWSKMSNDTNRANRLIAFYYNDMINDSTLAKDIRIYDQKRLIEKGTFIEFKSFSKYAEYNAKFTSFSTALTYLANGLIYLFAALKSYAGAFGVGSIVQYAGTLSQFGGGFSAIISSIGMLINNNVYLEKSLSFLDIPNKKYQGSLSVEKRDDNEYVLEFKDVSFQYPGSESYAIRHLNLKFNIGRRMAVVGMNGSGKTTMIKLLCRLYDPSEGMITLNGIDIKKYNYDEYMAIFSVVFQDFRLLPFTIGQNVAASVNVDRERAGQALIKSGFASRLDGMPEGLNTYLYKNFEEDGIEVSGGEAQKIAIARALYKNAPFIILDEPTAALDPVAEYEIYSKFNEIVRDKTAIYISHRLSSCRFCDDIAVFHKGRLIQRGSHEELILDNGNKYFELWNAQAQYYA